MTTDARYEVRPLPDSDPCLFGIYDLQEDAWLERPHNPSPWSTGRRWLAARLAHELSVDHRRALRKVDGD